MAAQLRALSRPVSRRGCHRRARRARPSYPRRQFHPAVQCPPRGHPLYPARATGQRALGGSGGHQPNRRARRGRPLLFLTRHLSLAEALAGDADTTTRPSRAERPRCLAGRGGVTKRSCVTASPRCTISRPWSAASWWRRTRPSTRWSRPCWRDCCPLPLNATPTHTKDQTKQKKQQPKTKERNAHSKLLPVMWHAELGGARRWPTMRGDRIEWGEGEARQQLRFYITEEEDGRDREEP